MHVCMYACFLFRQAATIDDDDSFTPRTPRAETMMVCLFACLYVPCVCAHVSYVYMYVCMYALLQAGDSPEPGSGSTQHTPRGQYV